MSKFAFSVVYFLLLIFPASSEEIMDPKDVSNGLKAIFLYSNDKQQEVELLNNGTVVIMTGTIQGTYAQFGADMASALDDGNKLRILPIIGHGSVQSIADVLYLRGVDMGIIRSDTLDYLEEKGVAKNIKSQLAYITRLYSEEMHVLAGKDIHTLQDLNGKTVSVDMPNGGTFITATNVFEELGIKAKFVYIEQRLAYEKLRKGEIDALVAVQGRPSKFFTLVKDPNLHFVSVPYDAVTFKSDYSSAKIYSSDYPNLIADGESVETIAVPAVLVAYNWQPNSPHYKKLEAFVNAFFSKMDQLQNPPFHPKWKELNLRADLPGWRRWQPAQAWLNTNANAYATLGTKAKFRKFLEEHAGGSDIKTMTEAQKKNLFNDFLVWSQTNKSQ